MKLAVYDYLSLPRRLFGVNSLYLVSIVPEIRGNHPWTLHLAGEPEAGLWHAHPAPTLAMLPAPVWEPRAYPDDVISIQ